MFLATSNPTRQLLSMRYIGQVIPAELERSEPDVRSLVAGLSPGFRLLVDLSQLDSMDLACQSEIGRMMELFNQAGVGMIVRVIPKPDKDIGFSILTIFHYPRHPQVITCENILEAGQHLAVGEPA